MALFQDWQYSISLFSPFHLGKPIIYPASTQSIIAIMLIEALDNIRPLHPLIGKELDDGALLDFY
jgi:hypothetical protein